MSEQLLQLVLRDTFAIYVDPNNKATMPDAIENQLTLLNNDVVSMKFGNVQEQKNKLSAALARGSWLLQELEGLFKGTISRAQYDFVQRLYSSLAIMKSYQAIYINSPPVDVLLQKLNAINDLARTDINTVEQLLNGGDGKGVLAFEEKAKRTGIFKFADIKGIDRIVTGIRNIIDNINLYSVAQFIILTGPPGTGKSILSRAIATQFSNGVFYNMGVGELSSPYVGETEAGLIGLFKKLRSTGTNSTIILDEFDTLYTSGQSHLNSVKTTIQTEIQGAGEPLPKTILIIAITNYADEIPKAIIRRSTQFFYVPPPTTDQCIEYLLEQMQVTNAKPSFVDQIKGIMGASYVFTNANMQAWFSNAKVDHITRNAKFTFNNRNGVLVEATADVLPDDDLATKTTLTKQDLTKEQLPYILVPTLVSFTATRPQVVPMTVTEIEEFEKRNNLNKIIT